MVRVPQGEGIMGAVTEDKFATSVELPPTRTHFSREFALSRTPVTQAQWSEVMGELPRECPTGVDATCPVVGVSFADVMIYLEKLSQLRGETYRLPSEAEWEYACRAGSVSIFPFGSNISLGDANYLYDERGTAIGCGALTPVMTYPANAFGFCDLLGNVCEWTADLWHPSHDGASPNGAARTGGAKTNCRTIRGGAWDHLPRVLRASWRDWAPEEARWDNLGFRVAHNL
tara:strand:+ start:4145 stop:4834 length:690 start_codon:yes stop_codon:yes gene_type:complete